MTTNKHSATGQMAGYLFQPDRALVLLCSCKNNESVSIEIIDDIATVDEHGIVIYREQAKNSIRDGGQPFKARSKDLWNTLMIWIEDIKNGKLDISITSLVCATNKKLEDNSLIKQISLAKSTTDIDNIISLLKRAADKPPDGLNKTIKYVLEEELILRQIIPQITLIDDNTLDQRNDEIANKLHLNDSIKEGVITDLRGWIYECILIQLDNGRAPIISKEDFNNRIQKAIQNEADKKIKVEAKKFVKKNIRAEDIDEAGDSIFVKQLELINHSDKSNIIIEAIDDFLCSENERTRLTLAGDLTKQELEEIDEESRVRWVEVFRRKITKYNSTMGEKELGELAFEIYDHTVSEYYARIRGNQTPSYFTKGSFHKLADELDIGWHPHWDKIFIKK